jgi:hypothetical protein
MKTIFATLIASSLFAIGCARAERAAAVPSWAVGYWAQVQDEDGMPGDETLEIRADGTVVVHGPACHALPPGTLHLNNGNLYATWLAPKGPISLVYVPSVDHKSLRFTSPRTGNNAVYAPAATCSPAEG